MASLKPRDAKGKISLENFTVENFLGAIENSRQSQGTSIENYDFNKSRCRILSANDQISEGSKGVLYWMTRDCRIHDNWGILFSQRLALKNKLPLLICFSLFEAHHYYPTRRHQDFLIKGLELVKNDCEALNINFYLINQSPRELVKSVVKNKLGGVVCDFSPLKKRREWIDTLCKALPDDIPIVQVDAHNIVPAWIASEKQEIMAKTLRPKINKKLSEYLTGFPAVIKHPYKGIFNIETISFDKAFSVLKTTHDVGPVEEAGAKRGLEMLFKFMQKGLKHYGITSNDPSKEHTSNLSFWINFGHISAQRVALEVKSLESLYKEQVDKYLEELIVRRELAENYCFYNENYDNLMGAADWARKSLELHAGDKRSYLYSKEEFEKGLTHDDCWNAAQFQLKKEGKIHGYMRMYWCKKILEWSSGPKEALDTALWLNDTFALDGNDPNGFVGVMWSICGVHDQGWREREVFGKIRFMVEYSLRRKFDMEAYCARYGVVGKKEQKKGGSKRKNSN
ncbi:deoxyribodipyrimidine photo-lyase [Anthonomus grandis grandis]|uniref:deoxyribodipyrimidine photo-lyase n=1 Tax=Anthonomus grandis grandis TaxID=2921223 RepID=UPI0021663974|nr:deoxyribodipyrimidine photo-lyase [Anthonomus grandis grandis]